MSNQVKLNDVLKPYSGEGDIEEWLLKVDLVAKLQKIKDVASFIRMFLEEDALTVYHQIPDEDAKNVDRIKLRLREAFGEDPFNAYEKFCQKKWKGESVDVFITNLRKLAKSAGIKEETVIKRAFVTGMPKVVAKEIRAMPSIELINVEDILVRTRALLAMERKYVYAVSYSSRQRRGNQRESENLIKRCYKCGGPHMIKECAYTSVVCFKCNKET